MNKSTYLLALVGAMPMNFHLPEITGNFRPPITSPAIGVPAAEYLAHSQLPLQPVTNKFWPQMANFHNQDAAHWWPFWGSNHAVHGVTHADLGHLSTSASPALAQHLAAPISDQHYPFAVISSHLVDPSQSIHPLQGGIGGTISPSSAGLHNSVALSPNNIHMPAPETVELLPGSEVVRKPTAKAKNPKSARKRKVEAISPLEQVTEDMRTPGLKQKILEQHFKAKFPEKDLTNWRIWNALEDGLSKKELEKAASASAVARKGPADGELVNLFQDWLKEGKPETHQPLH